MRPRRGEARHLRSRTGSSDSLFVCPRDGALTEQPLSGWRNHHMPESSLLLLMRGTINSTTDASCMPKRINPTCLRDDDQNKYDQTTEGSQKSKASNLE